MANSNKQAISKTTTIKLTKKLRDRSQKYKQETGVDMTAQISDALNKFLSDRGY